MKILWFEAQYWAMMAPNEPMGECFYVSGSNLALFRQWLDAQSKNGMSFVVLPEIHDPNNITEIIKVKFLIDNVGAADIPKVQNDIMIFKLAWQNAPGVIWQKFGDDHAA